MIFEIIKKGTSRISNNFLIINNSVRSFTSLLDSRIYITIVGVIIFFLSMIFTSPTRHGADRHYLLALNIIENRSINIQRLIEEKNHYALVSVDLLKFNGGKYNNLNPGQAIWGLPGLSVYRFVRHINNFSNGVTINREASDKIDFILGTYAMNLTSSALFTAIAAMCFMYLASQAFSINKLKVLKISSFVLLFYLATPLFYYSTHIIQNQSESSLVFISLGLLCLGTIQNNIKKMNKLFFWSGFVIGMAYLTNSSSLILLPFSIIHIFLLGFANVGIQGRFLFDNIISEIKLNWKRKLASILFLYLGFFIPTLVLLYYQQLMFSNPFILIQSYYFEIPKRFSPTLIDYSKAFFMDIFDTLFSSKVGLISFSPILVFPIILLFLKKSENQGYDENIVAFDHLLRKVLFRTMALIAPLYIAFYSLLGAKGHAEMGWEISAYNLYSARHILPIVFPLGFILFDVILKIDHLKPIYKWALRSILILLWVYSLIMNISATLIGDWIYNLGQTWGYANYLFQYGLKGFILQGRSLVDW